MPEMTKKNLCCKSEQASGKVEQEYDSLMQTVHRKNAFYWVIQKHLRRQDSGCVIWVDEYDKPMLQTSKVTRTCREISQCIETFYGVLKSLDGYIRFALLTENTKFGKVSVFSDLNNLNDISMDRDTWNYVSRNQNSP